MNVSLVPDNIPDAPLPPPPVELNVIVFVDALVVIVIPEPAANVRVPVLLVADNVV